MDSTQQIDYEKYENRLESFTRWPNESPDLIKELAEAGFYYFGESDVVECYACGVQISEWQDGDSPLERHETRNGECRHLVDRAIQQAQLQNRNSGNCSDNSNDSDILDDFGFDYFDKRVQSAKKYNSNLSTERLCSIAQAGLFYNNFGKQFECYCCHVQFDAPEVVDSDDPVRLHKETFSSCKHINLVTDNQKQHVSKPAVQPSPREPSSRPIPLPRPGNKAGLAKNRDTKPRTTPMANGLKLKMPMNGNQVPSPEKQISSPRVLEGYAFAIPSQPGYQKYTDSQPGSASPDFSGNSSPTIILPPFVPKVPGAAPFSSQFSRQLSNRSIPSDDEIMMSESHSPVQFQNRKSTLSTKYGRLQTFLTWPQDAMIQPNELCEAGFYYMGEDDGVKCYVCGILLRNWETGDTAWGEHKRWRPNCRLVIEHDVDAAKKNSQHAISENTQPWRIQQGRVQHNYYELRMQDVPHLQFPSSIPSAPFPLHDYRYPEHSGVLNGINATRYQNIYQPPVNYGSQQLSEQQGAVGSQQLPNDEEKSCKQFQEVEQIGQLDKAGLDILLDAGFAIEIICKVQKLGLERYGEDFESVQTFADAIVHYLEKGNLDEHSLPDMENAKSDQKVPNDEQTKTADGKQMDLKRELDKVREMQLCKICMDEQVGAAFHPCGHLFTCPKCAEGLQQCPLCRANIESTSRVYLS